MTVLIIEDEIPAAKRLQILLQKKGFSVLKIVNSIRDSKVWLADNDQPDYIFSDIKLRDGLCFSIFETVTITAKIIFTTAFDEFALKAFDFNSLDYLLKPIDDEKLDKILSKISINSSQDKFHSLLEQFNNTYRNSFLVPVGGGLKKIDCNLISHFVSENNATFLVTEDHRHYCVNFSLEILVNLLDPKQFFRINRKFIVNKKSIAILTFNGNLKLNGLPNIECTVSRSRFAKFRDWYQK